MNKKTSEVEVIEPHAALVKAEAEICRYLGKGGVCSNEKMPVGISCVGPKFCRHYLNDRAERMPVTLAVRTRRHVVNMPVAEALQAQYSRVEKINAAATREMVVFGAMLERINQALTQNRFNPDGEGVSLRSWLEEKCPAINYNTAMGYRRVTKNVLRYLKLKEDTPLLEMMYTDRYEDPAKEAVRQQLIETISGKTMNQLDMTTREKGKGNEAATGRKEVLAVDAAVAAAKDAGELIGKLNAFCFSGRNLMYLTEADLESLLHNLEICSSKIREVMQEK